MRKSPIEHIKAIAGFIGVECDEPLAQKVEPPDLIRSHGGGHRIPAEPPDPIRSHAGGHRIPAEALPC